MMNRDLLCAFGVGLLFGTGLLLSGMANPEKVLGFLDLAGAWDPSLALVMGGAVIVGLVAFSMAGKRRVSILGKPIQISNRRDIDRPLVLGGLGFGVGWGLAGFCPGPALVATGAGEPKGWVFVAAMLVGMGCYELIERTRQASASRLH